MGVRDDAGERGKAGGDRRRHGPASARRAGSSATDTAFSRSRPGEPGHGASFGNAGCFNGSSVTPVSMPGTIRNVPRWLLNPLGPLSLRWSYLPAIAPWLVRFMRAGTPEKVRAQASALRPLVGPTLKALRPLVSAAGARGSAHWLGHLYVYRSVESLKKDHLAWELRRNGGRNRRIRR